MLKKYKGTFIFANSAKDDVMAGILDKIKGEIEKLGGEVLSVDIKGRRTFARPMSKRESGIYVIQVFTLDTESIGPLRNRFKLNDDIFRVQLIVNPPEVVAEAAAEEEKTEVVEEIVEG